MRKKEIVERVIEILDDDNIFNQCVDELDNWSGFANGERCYPMDELNELMYGATATELLKQLTSDFDINDDYVKFTIWGIESRQEIDYKDVFDVGELLDNLINNYRYIDLTYINRELDRLIQHLYLKDFDE